MNRRGFYGAAGTRAIGMISQARPSSSDARVASVPSTTYDPYLYAPDQIPSNAYHARSHGVASS